MSHTAANPRAAAAFMMAAAAFVAGTTLLAKALGTGLFGETPIGEPLHPVQVSFGRFCFAWIAVAGMVALLRPGFTRPAWVLHLSRTVCGVAGVTLMFAAAAAIPLADATAISFLNPIFAMVFAIPLLGERVGPWRWLAAAIGVLGAVALIRPGSTGLQLGALLALGSAIVLGLEAIIIQRLSGREATVQILLVNNTMGLVIVSLAVLPVWQAPSAAQWACLAALGILMAMAQFCFVNAIARADASFVTPLFYLTLVFAAVYDFAIFGALPAALSLLGIGLILTGAVILAWRETARNPKATK